MSQDLDRHITGNYGEDQFKSVKHDDARVISKEDWDSARSWSMLRLDDTLFTSVEGFQNLRDCNFSFTEAVEYIASLPLEMI